MRLIPIITAVAVTVTLFFLVVERDSLLAFANADDADTFQTNQPATEVQTEPAEDLIRVVAVRSQARSIDNAVVLRGETQADRTVDARAETSAQVISEPLRRGSSVSRGDVLCRLDPGTRDSNLTEARARLAEAQARIPENEARLQEAQARLDEALINDNAARKLSEGGFASETRVASAQAAVSAAEAGVQSVKSGLQSAEAGIDSAKAAVAAAEREIGRLTITAPFGGILEEDTAELGSLLQPGSLCATVIRLDPIRLVGFVPETEVNRITLGAVAGARLTTGQTVTGLVTFLSRSADPLTRTFRVEIEVANPDLAIRDGQTAEIAIAAAGAQAHLIPASALTLDDDGTLGVRLVGKDEIVSFLPIELLRDSPQGIWVGGLPADANVIIIGQEYVTAGVRVAPTYEGDSQ